ncbi:MAG: patatin-like phospholipase family protein [Bacteroidota bacterium]
MNKTIKNLVLEGGGVKGVAYAGALKVLEDQNIMASVERVAGTSAGAITACLVSLRYSADDISSTIKGMNLGSFDDKENIIKKIHYYGLHPGNTFLNWIKGQIANAGHGFGENATFEDFKNAGCRDLRVFSCDICTHTVQEFSFKATPKVVVAEAVRASMSIPLYFNAWKFTNDNPTDHLYVDGGMVYNYPITAFSDVDPDQVETLGLRLEDVNNKREISKFGYGHWGEYVKNTFETLMAGQTIDFHRNEDQVAITIIIDDLGVKATDFDISDETKNNLVTSGETATKNYLAKHSSTVS